MCLDDTAHGQWTCASSLGLRWRVEMGTDEMNKKMKAVFEDFDADKSRSISTSELSAAMEKMCQPVPVLRSACVCFGTAIRSAASQGPQGHPTSKAQADHCSGGCQQQWRA